MQATPAVQVIRVIPTTTALQVTIQCCFCGKKHYHGTNTVESLSLGTRVPHCDDGFPPLYELRLDDWHAAGKSIRK